jgi:thiol-disulfide isomerase/thioredoxin
MKVLKFGADWCSGCLVMRPRWEKIEDEMPELETEYYDFDTSKDKVEEFGVDSGRLPCFVFVSKSGEELERLTGEPSEKKLREVISRHLEK